MLTLRGFKAGDGGERTLALWADLRRLRIGFDASRKADKAAT